MHFWLRGLVIAPVHRRLRHAAHVDTMRLECSVVSKSIAHLLALYPP